MRALATGLLLSIAALSVPVVRAQSSLPDPCGVPQSAKVLLMTSGNVGGIESLPSSGLCQYSTRRTVPIDRSRVLDTLNRLVEYDPRYEWRIEDNVIVVRPADAWKNGSHFLGRTLSTFAVENVTFIGAINALVTPLAGFSVTGDSPGSNPTEQASRRFTVALGETSVMRALNAIVRHHGGLVWEINYCKPSARYEFATFFFRTFDQGGGGIHTAVLDHEGRLREACVETGHGKESR